MRWWPHIRRLMRAFDLPYKYVRYGLRIAVTSHNPYTKHDNTLIQTPPLTVYWFEMCRIAVVVRPIVMFSVYVYFRIHVMCETWEPGHRMCNLYEWMCVFVVFYFLFHRHIAEYNRQKCRQTALVLTDIPQEIVSLRLAHTRRSIYSKKQTFATKREKTNQT